LGLIPIHRKFSKTVPFSSLTPAMRSTFANLSEQIHKYEVPRKLLHVSIGFVVVYLYRNGYQPVNIIPPLAAALVPIASADLLRYYYQPFNAFYIKLLGALMRESEVRGQNGVAWTGVVWYLVGSITVLAVFPKDVATLSILLLSWCDTAASTFGRAWGRYTPRIRKGKSVAGSLGAFVVGALAAGVFLGFVVPSTPRWPDDPVNPVMWGEKLGIPCVGELTGGWALTAMSLLTGAVASLSEMLDAWGLDDNVVIPVASAAGMWGLLKVFG
jgi:diacylglycerol kinase (CTP)